MDALFIAPYLISSDHPLRMVPSQSIVFTDCTLNHFQALRSRRVSLMICKPPYTSGGRSDNLWRTWSYGGE